MGEVTQLVTALVSQLLVPFSCCTEHQDASETV